MSIKDANVNIQPVLTKEQKAYDEAIKNMKYITAELKLSQEGIDTEIVPYDTMKTIVSIFDEMDAVQREFNVEMQKFQLEANNKAKLLQEDANKKFANVQNRYREIMDSMKNIKKGTVSNNEYDTGNVTISKEREEEIKKELADALAQAKEEDKNE
jgi:phage-related tail protein